MKNAPLSTGELDLLQQVFARHAQVAEVTLFGSRAKGTHSPSSDVDLSLRGAMDELQIEALASDLDDLPLPYLFDVVDFASVTSVPLREHIERVGVKIYSVSDSLSINRVLPTKIAAQSRPAASST